MGFHPAVCEGFEYMSSATNKECFEHGAAECAGKPPNCIEAQFQLLRRARPADSLRLAPARGAALIVWCCTERAGASVCEGECVEEEELEG